ERSRRPELLPALPGLRVPVGARHFERHARRGGAGPERDEAVRAVVVTFDAEYLERDLLPALVRRHLAPVLGSDAEVRVTVNRTGEIVFASEGLAEDAEAAEFDWREPLFRPLPPEEIARLAFVTGLRASTLDGGAEDEDRVQSRRGQPPLPAER